MTCLGIPAAGRIAGSFMVQRAAGHRVPGALHLFPGTIMADTIEKQVEEMLQQGKSRRQAWNFLRDRENPHRLLFHLNNSSLPADRRKVQWNNLVLVVLLAFLTIKKLLVAFSFGSLDLALILSLIPAVINVYILREVLRFRRLGYKFLFVLSIVAFLLPENHHLQEASLLLAQVLLSGYILLVLFPKKDLIGLEEANRVAGS